MTTNYTHPSIIKSYGHADRGGKTHILDNGWRIDVIRSGGKFGLVSLDIINPEGEEFPAIASNMLRHETLPGGRIDILAPDEIEPVAEIAFGLIHSAEFQ